jgi:hypothetical protein
MTIQEAWDEIQDNIEGDCGPVGETWKSGKLLEAIEIIELFVRGEEA